MACVSRSGYKNKAWEAGVNLKAMIHHRLFYCTFSIAHCLSYFVHRAFMT